MRLETIWRTTTFRLSVLYGAVFALAILMLRPGIASLFCATQLAARIHHSRRHSHSSARHVAAPVRSTLGLHLRHGFTMTILASVRSCVASFTAPCHSEGPTARPFAETAQSAHSATSRKILCTLQVSPIAARTAHSGLACDSAPVIPAFA